MANIQCKCLQNGYVTECDSQLAGYGWAWWAGLHSAAGLESVGAAVVVVTPPN